MICLRLSPVATFLSDPVRCKKKKFVEPHPVTCTFWQSRKNAFQLKKKEMYKIYNLKGRKRNESAY